MVVSRGFLLGGITSQGFLNGGVSRAIFRLNGVAFSHSKLLVKLADYGWGTRNVNSSLVESKSPRVDCHHLKSDDQCCLRDSKSLVEAVNGVNHVDVLNLGVAENILVYKENGVESIVTEEIDEEWLIRLSLKVLSKDYDVTVCEEFKGCFTTQPCTQFKIDVPCNLGLELGHKDVEEEVVVGCNNLVTKADFVGMERCSVQCEAQEKLLRVVEDSHPRFLCDYLDGRGAVYNAGLSQCQQVDVDRYRDDALLLRGTLGDRLNWFALFKTDVPSNLGLELGHKDVEEEVVVGCNNLVTKADCVGMERCSVQCEAQVLHEGGQFCSQVENGYNGADGGFGDERFLKDNQAGSQEKLLGLLRTVIRGFRAIT
ncbi:hypothetical protein L1049_013195 [Liquidambar formosana]|uniref:Uncharacterized protein n=1 Tax=Liquidambar formosana TaxID=63359 RepID=A0AAP0RJX3_LIQFO